LLAERISLLSDEGRPTANRALDVLAAVPALRFAQPTASLGTWLQQVWIRLGGPLCVDRTARANLDLLWQSLDRLPNGEMDLLSPALKAALENLTAQPDPEASSDCGVQLMTIHKSKGLEFEIVIVPELQARSRKGESKLLSWLERGLTPEDVSDLPDSSEEITEFLVAPLQFKGADPSQTKKWVDHVYRERESQETRRILYVAATRARDELHFFAQPKCRKDKTGDWTLPEPKDSLLGTAWPALQSDINQRFATWKSSFAEPEAEPEAEAEAEPIILDTLAASASSNLFVMLAPIKPTLLRRLPTDYRLAKEELDTMSTAQSVIGLGDDPFYQRHEGGLLSRALGTAVHVFLESLSKLRKSTNWEQARADLKQFQSGIAAKIRATGVEPSKSSAIAAEALRLALDASSDPTGNWILSPHSDDSSEVRWTGVVAGSLRTVQVDRLFRGGLTPLSSGDEAWWIIDYKTAHADSLDPPIALSGMRKLFAPQLETYAKVLANLHGKDTPIRAGLYYPRMLLFDWWEI
jgi:ATP-dependent exoDNAse (exonuclease V) beta subunit